jgi:hypothetical protein
MASKTSGGSLDIGAQPVGGGTTKDAGTRTFLPVSKDICSSSAWIWLRAKRDARRRSLLEPAAQMIYDGRSERPRFNDLHMILHKNVYKILGF